MPYEALRGGMFVLFQNRSNPTGNPSALVRINIALRGGGGVRRGLGEAEHVGQARVFDGGVNPHFGRNRLLHFPTLQPLHQFCRQLRLFRSLQDCRAFDLAEYAAF